ncbi:hypothetical protein [Photorhabdus australis]|uniref:hypothetical protein n=1 Tax=Photorhabdus australis TaxID=286156 RepID=UPI00056D794D|nr:hypothetical protein [Photorhabdus australis]
MRNLFFISISLMIIAFPAKSKSLDDFFNDYPELSENIFTKNAIQDQAEIYATQEAMRRDIPMDKIVSLTNKLVMENGYNYARLGMRSLKLACSIPDVAEINSLSKSDCTLISKYAE